MVKTRQMKHCQGLKKLGETYNGCAQPHMFFYSILFQKKVVLF